MGPPPSRPLGWKLCNGVPRYPEDGSMLFLSISPSLTKAASGCTYLHCCLASCVKLLQVEVTGPVGQWRRQRRSQPALLATLLRFEPGILFPPTSSFGYFFSHPRFANCASNHTVPRDFSIFPSYLTGPIVLNRRLFLRFFDVFVFAHYEEAVHAWCRS